MSLIVSFVRREVKNTKNNKRANQAFEKRKWLRSTKRLDQRKCHTSISNLLVHLKSTGLSLQTPPRFMLEIFRSSPQRSRSTSSSGNAARSGAKHQTSHLLDSSLTVRRSSASSWGSTGTSERHAGSALWSTTPKMMLLAVSSTSTAPSSTIALFALISTLASQSHVSLVVDPAADKSETNIAWTMILDVEATEKQLQERILSTQETHAQSQPSSMQKQVKSMCACVCVCVRVCVLWCA